jgi:methionyl aminopeptidase
VAVIETKDSFEDWMTAGKVAARALRHGRDLCKPGARLVDVAAAVEDYIRAEGLGLAFPCTMSLNACAAHFTPTHDDGTVLQEGDLVKLDCGAEKNGALSDNALTLEVGGGSRHQQLIKAAEACLKEAISIIGPNVNLGDVGAAIELTANDHGVKPIQNLTGHSLERFNLHAGLTVPNVGMRVSRRPRIGDVLACEPFVTDGTAGRVENSGPGNIYHFQRARPQRMPSAKRLLGSIEKRYPKLPFAERWLTDAAEPAKLGFTLNQLQKGALIKHYPALSEASGGMVAQCEATLIITEDGCVVSTQP